MLAQLRSESIKLRSTRLLLGLVGAHLVVTLLQVVLIVVNAGRINTPSLGTTESFLRFIAASAYGQYIALVVGVLLVASEHRHKTISATYIIQPARGVVIAAKAMLGAVAGAAVAVAGLTATAAIVVPWLSGMGVDIDVAHSRYAVAVAGTVAVAAVYGALGVGLGALIPNATAAIGAAVGYALVVENLVVGLAFPSLLRWFPGGAATALVGARPLASGPVAPVEAAAVLLAYAAAFLVLGFAVTARRDVV